MHYGASPEIFRRASELRERMTPAELVLWEKLRAGKLNGLKFRRQHPVSKYIVDFYCHVHRLAIELDGKVHDDKDQKERDLGREEDLKLLGIHILRFDNQLVVNHTSLVLNRILTEIEYLKLKA